MQTLHSARRRSSVRRSQKQLARSATCCCCRVFPRAPAWMGTATVSRGISMRGGKSSRLKCIAVGRHPSRESYWLISSAEDRFVAPLRRAHVATPSPRCALSSCVAPLADSLEGTLQFSARPDGPRRSSRPWVEVSPTPAGKPGCTAPLAEATTKNQRAALSIGRRDPSAATQEEPSWIYLRELTSSAQRISRER